MRVGVELAILVILVPSAAGQGWSHEVSPGCSEGEACENTGPLCQGPDFYLFCNRALTWPLCEDGQWRPVCAEDAPSNPCTDSMETYCAMVAPYCDWENLRCGTATAVLVRDRTGCGTQAECQALSPGGPSGPGPDVAGRAPVIPATSGEEDGPEDEPGTDPFPTGPSDDPDPTAPAEEAEAAVEPIVDQVVGAAPWLDRPPRPLLPNQQLSPLMEDYVAPVGPPAAPRDPAPLATVSQDVDWPTVARIVGGATAAVAGLTVAIWYFVSTLFARVQPARALSNPRRAQLMEIVREQPGIEVSDLARRASMARSVARHHLAVLERAELLRLNRVGGRAVCYAVLAVPHGEVERVALLRRPTVANLVRTLHDRPGLAQTDLAQHLGVSQQRVSTLLRGLEGARLVRSEPAGRTHRYYAVPTTSPVPPEATPARNA